MSGGRVRRAGACGVVAMVLGLGTVGACSDRAASPPIDWPAPDEIAQKRMTWDCAIVEGGARCWSGRESLPPQEQILLQRDEPWVGPPLPFLDLGTGAEILSMGGASPYTRCALLEQRGIKCWGSNEFFQLGRPDPEEILGDDPTERGDALPYVDLGTDRDIVGLSVHCALFASGRVKCWGPGRPSLGLGDLETRGDDPGEMGDALPYVDLGTGVRAVGLHWGVGGYVCIWTDEGRVKCWGENERGQLGVESGGQPLGDEPGEMGDALPYVDLGTDVFVVQVSASAEHTCALTDEGRIKCWGANSTLNEVEPPAVSFEPDQFGRLGLGDKEDRRPPLGDALPYVDLGTDVHAVAVQACGAKTCAVLDDGRLKCWGSNEFGSLGYEDRETRGDEPGEMGDALPYVDLGTGRTVRALACSCAWLDDDSIKCWGPGLMGGMQGTPGTMGDALEPLVTAEYLVGKPT